MTLPRSDLSIRKDYTNVKSVLDTSFAYGTFVRLNDEGNVQFVQNQSTQILLHTDSTFSVNNLHITNNKIIIEKNGDYRISFSLGIGFSSNKSLIGSVNVNDQIKIPINVFAGSTTGLQGFTTEGILPLERGDEVTFVITNTDSTATSSTLNLLLTLNKF